MVPQSLRRWFVFHFIADLIFAVPLFVAPRAAMALLGFDVVDPVATRLVAAALFGIGITSLTDRAASHDTFRTMLTLKVIWSGTATLGLILSALQGAPAMTWGLALIFGGFHCVWLRYRALLRNAANA